MPEEVTAFTWARILDPSSRVSMRVAEEGGPELAERLENEGYDRYLEPSDVVEA